MLYAHVLFYEWWMLLPFDVVEDVIPLGLHVATFYLWQMSLPLHHTPLISGKDLWMTPLPSSTHHRKEAFWTT